MLVRAAPQILAAWPDQMFRINTSNEWKVFAVHHAIPNGTWSGLSCPTRQRRSHQRQEECVPVCGVASLSHWVIEATASTLHVIIAVDGRLTVIAPACFPEWDDFGACGGVAGVEPVADVDTHPSVPNAMPKTMLASLPQPIFQPTFKRNFYDTVAYADVRIVRNVSKLAVNIIHMLAILVQSTYT